MKKDFWKGAKRQLIIISVLDALVGIGILSDKLDKRTPEEKERDFHEYLRGQCESLKRPFPTMNVDGEIVKVDIDWHDAKFIIHLPKTYGFGSTRWVNRTVEMPSVNLANAKIYGRHLLLPLTVRVYVGPTPTHSARYVAIPVESIPERFGSQLPKVDVETQENMKSKKGIEPTR